MMWEGKEAVKTGRKMLGATNPLESEPGTIRGDFCIEVGRNICHGSDTVENMPNERLACGSKSPSYWTGLATPRTGSTSRYFARPEWLFKSILEHALCNRKCSLSL